MSDYKWKPFTLLVSAEEVEKDVGVKLEAGKYYKTRDGRKVGPMQEREFGFFCDKHNYTTLGMAAFPGKDIISEWQESPIREVTRRELVAGQYGGVLVDEKGYVVVGICHKPEELREAAHTLNQIAEVLEENEK